MWRMFPPLPGLLLVGEGPSCFAPFLLDFKSLGVMLPAPPLPQAVGKRKNAWKGRSLWDSTISFPAVQTVTTTPSLLGFSASGLFLVICIH